MEDQGGYDGRLRLLAVWMSALAPFVRRRILWAPPSQRHVDDAGQRRRALRRPDQGKIVAVNLIYTTCKYACPLETARLAQVARLLGARMGRDIFFYSISIDPEVDTPAVLKAYAQKYGAGPGWTFLTGKKEDIEQISRSSGCTQRPTPRTPMATRPIS
jgi:protein SCO1/2